MMNCAWFLVEIGGYLVFWALFEWLNFFDGFKMGTEMDSA